LLIRSATTADLPAMMALEKHAVTASHWSAEHYQQIFALSDPCRLALVLEEQSIVLGFLVARALYPEWEIENLAIAASAQRRGLGTRLLREFLDLTRRQGTPAVFLEVRESNLAARGLYEKRGFIESGRRKRYYRNPEEDAILYRLSFA
jgi:[ribosomal protein S18]-alanine N-acetyltransferase